MSKISTETQDFLYFLAFLYFKNGKNDKAYTLLSLLVDLQPDSIRVNSVLGLIQLKKKAYAAAIASATRVLECSELRKDQKMAYYIMSRACLGKNQFEEARTHFNKFLEMHAD